MKLLRVGEKGKEKKALLVSEDEALDASSLVKDLDPDLILQGGPGHGTRDQGPGQAEVRLVQED